MIIIIIIIIIFIIIIIIILSYIRVHPQELQRTRSTFFTYRKI
jgi:hypothetical protein